MPRVMLMCDGKPALDLELTFNPAPADGDPPTTRNGKLNAKGTSRDEVATMLAEALVKLTNEGLEPGMQEAVIHLGNSDEN